MYESARLWFDLIWLYLVVASRLCCCCIYFSSFFSFSTFDLFDEEEKKCSQTYTFTERERAREKGICTSAFVAVHCCCFWLCAVRWSQKHFIAFDSLYLLWTLKNVFATHCRFIWCFWQYVCVLLPCAWLRWALVIRAYSYFYSVLTVYLFIFYFFLVPFCCFVVVFPSSSSSSSFFLFLLLFWYEIYYFFTRYPKSK